MPDDNVDNPYAPPELVDEMPIVVKAEPSMFYKVTHAFLLVWAVPMFLYCIFIPFVFLGTTAPGWVFVAIYAVTFPFVVACIGMIFHKIWAFALCVVYSLLWVAQPFVVTDSTPEDGSGPPFEGLYVLAEFAIALYGIPVLVSSLILFILSLKQHHKLRASKALRLNTNP